MYPYLSAPHSPFHPIIPTPLSPLFPYCYPTYSATPLRYSLIYCLPSLPPTPPLAPIPLIDFPPTPSPGRGPRPGQVGTWASLPAPYSSINNWPPVCYRTALPQFPPYYYRIALLFHHPPPYSFIAQLPSIPPYVCMGTGLGPGPTYLPYL